MLEYKANYVSLWDNENTNNKDTMVMVLANIVSTMNTTELHHLKSFKWILYTISFWFVLVSLQYDKLGIFFNIEVILAHSSHLWLKDYIW